MVAARSPINSAIALVVCLLSIAGHYILLNAQFLAMVHVIVYTGAMLVLMLFVIMLLNMNEEVEVRKPLITRILAILTAGLLLLVLLAATRQGLEMSAPESFNPGIGLVKAIGMALFHEFLILRVRQRPLPFGHGRGDDAGQEGRYRAREPAAQ